MRVTSIEVNLVDLPLHEPFVASHGTTSVRTITVARIDTDKGSGWGECSALPAATYTSESAAGTFRYLADDLGPRLIGQKVSPEDALSAVTETAQHPMALACIEMAVIDVALKAADRSLADWLGVDRATIAAGVAAGVSIGLDSIEATVTKARALAAEGYGRLKVKIESGHDLELVAALRSALPEPELQVDANGAYGPDDLDRVLRIVDLGVDAVEQPFAPIHRATTSDLIVRLGQRTSGQPAVPVVADEAVESLHDANELLAHGAMTGLSIKPPRVGGLQVARTMHDLCLANDLPATAGGMLETGLGRHALVAMAGLPGFSLIGDLSPAGRWLAADPWPDLILTDGRLAIPEGPGVAPPPDLDILDHHLVERRRIG